MMRIQALSTANLAACQGLQAEEVIMVMPCTDVPLARRAATLMAQRANAPGLLLLVEDLHQWGFVRIANQVFAATQSRYFGYVAQDAFAGRQWLALALAALAVPGKSLFGFNDGKWLGAFAAFGLAERQWAAQNYANGQLFHPAYQRHYADVDMSILAMNQGRYIHDSRSLLIEVDWHKDNATADPQDRQLYRARVASGFDGRVANPQLLNLVS